jgi:hypothetical protein
MMLKGSWRIFAVLLLAVLFPLSLAAQATSSLVGVATDSTGAALPGVTVTATNVKTGLVRTTVTESDGTYRLALPVGTYRLSAELSGLATTNIDNVELNVATERKLDLKLGPASVSENITVTAEAPLIATSPSVGTVVSQRELENLPLNGRQFANLATLAPGTQLSVNSDPTKPGQLTIALNGGSGRNVNFIIDGGDNTDDTIGGALQNFNLEAVQEFKIQTMQYKAEFGRSTGGVLSVVTKSGTNNLSGSAYGFFRNKSLNSETESERIAGIGKQDYERNQYGASIGGPIIRDRAHFFATYEKTKRDNQYVVNTGGVFPEFDNKSFPIPFQDELGTAKATVDLTAKQFLQVRYGYQKNTDIYGSAPVYLPNAIGFVGNDYKSALGSHTYQINSDTLNEALYQFTRFENTIFGSNDPTLIFPSGVLSGQNINTPQSTVQEKHQFKDDLSWAMTFGGMRNDFKTGLNYIHEPILGGDLTSGTAGQYTMLTDDPNGPVREISIFGGFLGFKTPVEEYSVYLQDDLSVNPRLTLNVGLRYDLFTGFDLNQAGNPSWETLKASTLDIPWLKPFQNATSDKLDDDKNNWSPRLGFSYDLTGDSRNIIRGGYGYYYDFPYTNATILFPSAAVESSYGLVFHAQDPNGIKNPDGSFFHPGQTLPGNDIDHPDFSSGFSDVASPNQETPLSKQASLGYSWQATPWLGVNVEAVSVRYSHIPYRFRANPMIDTNGDGSPDTRAFPNLPPNFRVWAGNGTAKYDGVNLGFHARMGTKLEGQGFYTLSKTTGNVLVGADEFRLWDASIQPGITRDTSVNPLDPTCGACYGPLYTDARHKLTLSTLYHAPLDINVSGILRYRSALPYTKHAGVDLNGDGYVMDLATDVSHVNSERGHAFSQFDLRVSRDFVFTGSVGLELIAEMFNVFNAKNPTAFNGNQSASNFGRPTRYAGDPGQGEQQLAQLGVRVHF